MYTDCRDPSILAKLMIKYFKLIKELAGDSSVQSSQYMLYYALVMRKQQLKSTTVPVMKFKKTTPLYYIHTNVTHANNVPVNVVS